VKLASRRKKKLLPLLGLFCFSVTVLSAAETLEIKVAANVAPPPFLYQIVSATAQTAGQGWIVTVKAVNDVGLVLPEINRTLSLSSTGAALFYTDETYAVTTAKATLAAGLALLYVRDTVAETILLTVDDGAGKTAASAPIFIQPAAPALLKFSIQPLGGSAGNPLAVQPAIVVLDVFDNPTNAQPTIALTLEVNPSGAVLSGTQAVTAQNGTAVFSDLKLDRPGNGYVLKASAENLTATISNPFNVSEGDSDGDGDGDAGKPPRSLMLKKLMVKTNYQTPGNDAVTFNGSLEPDSGFRPAEAAVVVNVGGAKWAFTLDKKGRAKGLGSQLTVSVPAKPKPGKPVTAKISFRAKAQSSAAFWQEHGLSNETVAKKVSLPVLISINGIQYATVMELTYKARLNLKGTAK
jgi:hypothetical protein